MTRAEQSLTSNETRDVSGHRRWVRLVHWCVAIAVIVLLYSGFTILQAHPRLYWGETGNYLMPAWLELPISPNYRYQDTGIEATTPFFDRASSPVSGLVPHLPYNENGWARSLHFLAGWGFLAGYVIYLVVGVVTGHIRRNIWPRGSEVSPGNLWSDVRAHLTGQTPTDHIGPPYNTLQKLAYAVIVLVALPLMILSGMTMSPAIAANWQWLLDLFGGLQSARSIHFLSFAVVAAFLLAHLAMILLTGPARQLRGMIWGK